MFDKQWRSQFRSVVFRRGKSSQQLAIYCYIRNCWMTRQIKQNPFLPVHVLFPILHLRLLLDWLWTEGTTRKGHTFKWSYWSCSRWHNFSYIIILHDWSLSSTSKLIMEKSLTHTRDITTWSDSTGLLADDTALGRSFILQERHHYFKWFYWSLSRQHSSWQIVYITGATSVLQVKLLVS